MKLRGIFKQKLSRSFSIFLALFLSSCQTFQRSPASSENQMPAQLQKLYDTELELLVQKEQLRREQLDLSTSERENFLSETVKKLREQKASLANQTVKVDSNYPINGDYPKTYEGTSYRRLGTKEEEFTLGDISLYSKDSGSKSFFAMNNSNSEIYELLLRHEFFKNQKGNEHDGSNYLDANISCDAPFYLKTDILSFDKFKAFQTARFNWYDAKLNAQKVRFRPTPEVKKCQISFRNPFENKSKEYELTLVTENEKLGHLQKLSTSYEACSIPVPTRMNKAQQLFLSTNYQYLNCPVATESLQTLENPEDGVQAKVEMLLGQKLPQKFFDDKNPFAPLDFSKAPKLDAIFASYLVFRSDFYGNVLTRLFKYHADRGTQVRIFISDVITMDKDRALLTKLAAENGNVKVTFYRYDNIAKSGGMLHELHRTNHVKLFLTLSSTDPSANRVVLGGRNIHDGFVFRAAPNFTSFPSLVNYSKGEESFVHWRDFEFKINSKSFAEKLALQFYSLWQQDSVTFNIRPTVAQDREIVFLDPHYFSNADEHPLIRHLVSIPYKDDHTLEDFYADLINSATKKVLISTPYFRPLKKVGQALKNAVERGVKITLITRLDLDGDTADFILGAVNKDGVNKFKDAIQIFEYTEPKVILHSKLALIDDEMSFIGSVNLNKRSFIHDMENASLVYSPAFTKKMESIYEIYKTKARPVTEKQKVYLYQHLIIDALDSEF
ncbi:MAG: phospholipase D-like domain-containing protein [Bdellovibrio sp.]